MMPTLSSSRRALAGVTLFVTLPLIASTASLEAQTATLSGRVVAAAGADAGLPIAGAYVVSRGDRGTVTDADGHWTLEVTAGPQNVAVGEAPGYFGEVLGGGPCFLEQNGFATVCSFEGGQVLDLADGDVVDGLDFALLPSGSVAGQVVSAGGAPIVDGYVTVRTASYRWLREVPVDADGSFGVDVPLPGAVVLVARASGHSPTLFGGGACSLEGCDPADGTAIAIESSAAVRDLEIQLTEHAVLFGVVRDAVTGAVLERAQVDLYDRGTGDRRTTNTDADGGYHFTRLPARGYSVVAEAYRLRPETSDGTRVLPADDRSRVGEPVELGNGEGRVANFSLEAKPVVEIPLVDAATGQPVDLLSSGCFWAFGDGLLGGAVEVAERECLDGGVLRAYLSAPGSASGAGTLIVDPDEYATRVVGGGSCTFDSLFAHDCRFGDGTPVLVEDTEVLRLEAEPLERHGVLTLDTEPVDPAFALDSVRYLVYSDTGEPILQRTTHPSVSSSFELAPGRSYRARAQGWAAGEPSEPQLWDHVECSVWNCDIERGDEIVLAAGETKAIAFDLARSTTPCVASDTVACLDRDRFALQARWRDFEGDEGEARVVQFTGTSAYLWFFGPSNVEAMVKVLNGCSIEGFERFWVYAAGLTNVEVDLVVTDTLTGEVWTATNPLGESFQPIFDVDAFATCDAAVGAPLDAPPAARPTATDKVHCGADLHEVCIDDRFAVSADWSTADAGGAARAEFLTADTAWLWFFAPDTAELLVKVIDACDAFGRRWVFAAGLTDVGVTLRVRDVETGEVLTYENPRGQAFQPVLDVDGFACSP